MEKPDKIRVDKWLWAVRIFKTRSLASEAIKKGRVTINGTNIKPSREARIGETINVKLPPIVKSFKVIALSGKRMGAKLTIDFVEDVTTQEQIDLLNSTKNYGFERRDNGVGRPTKYQRRMIDKLKDSEE